MLTFVKDDSESQDDEKLEEREARIQDREEEYKLRKNDGEEVDESLLYEGVSDDSFNDKTYNPEEGNFNHGVN